MKIAIDISPLKTGHFLQHRVRGTGAYIENLKGALLKYFPDNSYIFYTRGENVSKDINLTHIPYFEPFFMTLPIWKLSPTIVTVHDLIPLIFPEHFPAGIRGRIKWRVQKILLNRADAIVTDSQTSKKDIIKFTGIPEKYVYVIHLAASDAFHPIDDTGLLDNIKAKYQLPEKFVLYVGDATWNKNLPRLIEAIKKINVNLVMVGKALESNDFDESNPWNKDLVKIQNLAKGDERITRLGFVPTDDLVFLYNAATVFAMPSLYEGFGLPVLEAMACGTPVVTSKAGSLPEIAANAAFYTDAYDVENIADGIGKIFFNKKLQNEFSGKGLKNAEKFTWEKTAKETVNMYKKICKIS